MASSIMRQNALNYPDSILHKWKVVDILPDELSGYVTVLFDMDLVNDSGDCPTYEMWNLEDESVLYLEENFRAWNRVEVARDPGWLKAKFFDAQARYLAGLESE